MPNIPSFRFRRAGSTLQVLCGFALSLAALSAQTPSAPHAYLSSSGLDAMEQTLKTQLAASADKTAAVHTFLTPTVTKYPTLIFHRDVASLGEIHEGASDLGIIRSGSGSLRYGGAIVNPTTPNPGEPRGPGLQRFQTLPLGTGDIFYVPAGMPHQFVPDEGKTMTVMLFKPAGLKPADRPANAMAWSAAKLDSMTKDLASHLDAMKGANVSLVANGESVTERRVLMGYREAGGVAESHQAVAEFVYMRAGSGTVTIGGTIVGGKTTAPGETQGASLQGGTAQTFQAGDLIFIGEGTPHQFAPAPGKSFNAVLLRFLAR